MKQFDITAIPGDATGRAPIDFERELRFLAMMSPVWGGGIRGGAPFGQTSCSPGSKR